MTQANDSILVTPGSGATVATHLVSSKEYQVMMEADASAHVLGTKETYVVQTGNQVNVAAASTLHFDIFNASGSGKTIKIIALYIIPTQAAVTGIGLTWEIVRTSAVGTGGTSLTPRPYDTAHTLSASVTARGKATGGATAGATLITANTSSEETSSYAGLASVLNHVPLGGAHGPHLQGIKLAENEGLRVNQTTNSSVGSTNIVCLFTSE